MLTLADIKKMAYLNDFRKGMDMQRFGDVRDFEYSIYNVNASPVAEISAKVRMGEDSYTQTSVIVEEDYADISEYHCDCDEVVRYDGICKHCVAVLAEYVQKRRVKEVFDVKWNKTDTIQRGFLQQTPVGMKIS